MAKRFLVRVCPGGDPGGEGGCGHIVKAPLTDKSRAGDPAPDCPTCGLDRYYDYRTQREIDLANGLA
jgi:hypothetical protein